MAAATNNNNNNSNNNGGGGDNSNSSTNSSPRQQGPGSPLGAGGGGGGMAIPGVASPATVVVGVSPSQLASTMAFVSGASSEQQHSAAMRFSGHTLDKATKAKVHLENYYSNLITQHKERRIR